MAGILNVTSRNIKKYWALKYNRATDTQPWNSFVRRFDTNQPDGEEFGGRDPGLGMQEEGMPQSYETRAHRRFTLPIRRFNIGRVLSEEDVEANKVSKAQDEVDEAVDYCATHPGEMVEDLIYLGDSTTDPLDDSTSHYFFDETHTRKGSLADQSNMFAGTSESGYTTFGNLNVSDTSAPTDDEWGLIIYGLAAKMMMQTDYAGRRISKQARSFTIATGITLWESLAKYLAKQHLGSGEDNEVLNGPFTIDQMLLPNADDNKDAANGWMFVNGKKPMLLEYYEEAKKPKVFGPGTEHYEINNEMLIKARGQYNVGFLHYQYACQFLLK